MHEDKIAEYRAYEAKIAEYRAAAAACARWAESDEISEATRLRWRKLADEWTSSAEEVERKQSAEYKKFQPTGN